MMEFVNIFKFERTVLRIFLLAYITVETFSLGGKIIRNNIVLRNPLRFGIPY